MKELIVLLAKTMTKEQIVDRMQQSIDQYKEAKLLGKEDLKEEEEHLLMSCHICILNNIDKNPMEIINEMEKVNKRVQFFESDKN